MSLAAQGKQWAELVTPALYNKTHELAELNTRIVGRRKFHGMVTTRGRGKESGTVFFALQKISMSSVSQLVLRKSSSSSYAFRTRPSSAPSTLFGGASGSTNGIDDDEDEEPGAGAEGRSA